MRKKKSKSKKRFNISKKYQNVKARAVIFFMVNIGFSITITNSLGNRDHPSFVCQATNSKDDTSDHAESKNDRTDNPRNGGYLETKGNKPDDDNSNSDELKNVERNDTSTLAESKNDRTDNPRNGGYLETKGNKPNDCHRSNSSNGTQVREVNRTSSDLEVGRPISPGRSSINRTYLDVDGTRKPLDRENLYKHYGSLASEYKQPANMPPRGKNLAPNPHLLAQRNRQARNFNPNLDARNPVDQSTHKWFRFLSELHFKDSARLDAIDSRKEAATTNIPRRPIPIPNIENQMDNREERHMEIPLLATTGFALINAIPEIGESAWQTMGRITLGLACITSAYLLLLGLDYAKSHQ